MTNREKKIVAMADIVKRHFTHFKSPNPRHLPRSECSATDYIEKVILVPLRLGHKGYGGLERLARRILLGNARDQTFLISNDDWVWPAQGAAAHKASRCMRPGAISLALAAGNRARLAG